MNTATCVGARLDSPVPVRRRLDELVDVLARYVGRDVAGFEHTRGEGVIGGANSEEGDATWLSTVADVLRLGGGRGRWHNSREMVVV